MPFKAKESNKDSIKKNYIFLQLERTFQDFQIIAILTIKLISLYTLELIEYHVNNKRNLDEFLISSVQLNGLSSCVEKYSSID